MSVLKTEVCNSYHGFESHPILIIWLVIIPRPFHRKVYLTCVFLPLIGSLCAGFGGRFLGPQGAAILTNITMLICCLCGLVAFYEVGLAGGVTKVQTIVWIDSELFNVYWGFLFDSLTAVMIVVVTFISCCVHLYSSSYMSADPHLPRFMSYLSLFTFFMLILISGDNYLQMFVGWEGVGLCSYLLINF